jgi:hypothetical protein
MKDETVFAFEVNVAGREWAETVNARTSGQAKSEYFQGVRESWPGIPFTALRCRKIGRPHTSKRFEACASYRGLAGLQCGQRVVVGGARGVIVGHNSSANFDVLFDSDSPKYAGLRLNVHPDSMEMQNEE